MKLNEAEQQTKDMFIKWMVDKTPEEIAEGVIKYGNAMYNGARKAALDNKVADAVIKTIFEPQGFKGGCGNEHRYHSV